MEERGNRKEQTGTVLSNKMTKTVVVETRRRVLHELYGKVIVRRSKFYAHDEKGTAGPGDVVRIRECRPLSRLKRWTVVEIVRQGPERVVIAPKKVVETKKVVRKKVTKRASTGGSK